MSNGKKASRSRDHRISEIPTAAPFAVGLARAGGGAERSSLLPLWFCDMTGQKRCLLSQCCSFPASRPSSFSLLFPNTPSLGPSGLVMRRQPLSPRPTQKSPSVGLAAAEKPGGTACLEPEPSICHSGLDPLDCRDGDPSGSQRMIEIRA